MIDSQQPEDSFESNQISLQTLVRAIERSQGNFSLIFARCNYGRLRDRILQQLRERYSVEIREISLQDSVKTLYTTIKNELGIALPTAVMVYGFESVSSLDCVLTSANQVREEFPKNFPCLLVLWINDEVLKNFVQFAPDFWSWGISCEFTMATDELVALLQEYSERIFSNALEAGDQFLPNSLILDSDYHQELDFAQKDLQTRHHQLEPRLEASLQFLRGRDEYANDQIEAALNFYQQSLNFWEQINNLERQGLLSFHIGLCYCRQADLQRSESRQYWEEAKDYFQQCLAKFAQAQRSDLIAMFIVQLGKVLQRLEAWADLQNLALQAIPLHKTWGSPVEMARDYGFLAEVALENHSISGSIDSAKDAEKLALQALQILSNTPENQQHQSLYFLLLARSQRYLNQPENAIANLEKAKESSISPSDPLLYIRILKELRSLYYDRKHYLKAFKIKQEQGVIEQKYGFRAFIGASRLQPQSPNLSQAEPIFGRQQDVERLINERISSQDKKLTVIHGQSGVGKSSIIDAGLVPVLKEKNIGSRKALPILVRVYRDWLGTVGQALAEALKEISDIDLPEIPNSLADIKEQLQENNQRNLLTVLIFDQFEEFFFVNAQPSERQSFYALLKDCLNSVDIGFVRVILCLREDYIHNLLEYERFVKLDKTNDDILSEKNRYYIGNFSPDDAKSVIESLTERSQFYLEPALVDELVQELAIETGEISPIELQVVGAQLQAEGIKTLAQYQERGTRTKLVQRYLDEVIQDCGVENERAAQLVLFSLTDEKTIRPFKTKAELKADVKLQDEQLHLVLEILEGSGLVFRVPELPEDRYQLVHDYLVPFIRQQQEPLFQIERAMQQLDEEGLKHTSMQLEGLLQKAIIKRIEEEKRQTDQIRRWVETAETEEINSQFQRVSISGFTDYKKVLIALRDDLQHLLEFSKKLNLGNSFLSINNILERLQSSTFTIAVVGEFKRGRSTFINALLGQEILPVDVLPCSAAITRVTYGEEPFVKLLFRDGHEGVATIEKLADYVTKLTPKSEKTAANVKEAIVYYPVNYCQNNVDIIDTPGLNDEANMTEVTLSILPQVDAAIMVIMAQSPLSVYEQKFLATKLLTNDLGRIIFVVTGIDRYDNSRIAEKGINYIQDRIQKLILDRAKEQYGEDSPEYEIYKKKIGEAKIFGLSAHQALQAKLTNNQVLLSQSRFPEFEKALEKFLTQERGATFLQVPVNRAIASASEILATLEKKENAIDMKQQEFRAAYDKSVADLKALQERNFAVMKIIDAALRENENQLKDNQINKDITTQISGIFESLQQKVQQEAESFLDSIQKNLTEIQTKMEREEAITKPQRQEINQMRTETYRILSNAQRLSQQLIQQINLSD